MKSDIEKTIRRLIEGNSPKNHLGRRTLVPDIIEVQGLSEENGWFSGLYDESRITFGFSKPTRFLKVILHSQSENPSNVVWLYYKLTAAEDFSDFNRIDIGYANGQPIIHYADFKVPVRYIQFRLGQSDLSFRIIYLEFIVVSGIERTFMFYGGKLRMAIKLVRKNRRLIGKFFSKARERGVVYALQRVLKKTDRGDVPIRAIPSQGGTERQRAIPLESVEMPGRQPGRIAVHLHLYYLDLLRELVGYFANMPYDFDLYVTVVEGDDRKIAQEVRDALRGAKLGTLSVTRVENRGRDVAPFLSTFATRHHEYDYICHVHSKKSVFTGSVQDDWRTYLFQSLFGSTDLIRKIFGLFASSSNVGIVYPTTFEQMPYWAHSWLSNRQSSHRLGNRLGIALDVSKYVDYPVGSMFWAKTGAIEPLFKAGFVPSDFPPEPLPNDGTLCHAIERTFCLAARLRGFAFVELDVNEKSYALNHGKKNLHQYWHLSGASLWESIRGYDAVSFDIFDTIVTRPLLNPDHLFHLIEARVKRELGLDIEYMALRKESESFLRERLPQGSDVAIGSIYAKFADLSRLSAERTNRIQELEIECEVSLSLPREGMIPLLAKLQEHGKRVVLLSDMYLTSHAIRRILNKHGTDLANVSISVSSETGKRKDTATVWASFLQEIARVHVGDNEHSDIQLAIDRHIPARHVMSPTRLFELTDLISRGLPDCPSFADSIYLGPVIARLFSSPFRLHPNGMLKISDPREVGYCIVGPIVLYFITWLYKMLNEQKIEHILFLAREGFLLKQAYGLFADRFGGSDVKKTYLLCSRPGVSVSTLNTKSDIYELLEIDYNGSFDNLLKSRFGIDMEQRGICCANDLGASWKLPQDAQRLFREILQFEDIILENAHEERKGYLWYLNSVGITPEEKTAVVDIGYSATMQKYLSKIANRDFYGYYFATSSKVKDLSFSDKIFGCFGNYLKGNEGNFIYDYSLTLECVLTAQQGQFICFRKNGKTYEPLFGGGREAQEWSLINAMQAGVMDYITDVLNWFGEAVMHNSPSTETVELLYRSLCNHPDLLSTQLQDVLSVDDYYVSGKIMNAFHYFK